MIILLLLFAVLSQPFKDAISLSVIDLDAIIIQKQRLMISLEAKKETLSNEPAKLKKVESKLKHLDDLDTVLSHSLRIYYRILQTKDLDQMEEFMSSETDLIIQGNCKPN
jgi:hypothetical protein